MQNTFQLLLEFEAPDSSAFSRVLLAERTLDEWLSTGRMDGNEVGRTFVNICVITPDPVACFSEVMRLVSPMQVVPLRASYSDLEDGETIKPLWPSAEVSASAL